MWHGRARRRRVFIRAIRRAREAAKGRPSSLLQRLIELAEIAHLLAYVAIPLSSATDGAALRDDGGVTPTIA